MRRGRKKQDRLKACEGINAGIDKDKYLGEEVTLSFLSVDKFAALILKHGRGCFFIEA